MLAQLGDMYVIQNLKDKCGDIRKSGCTTCAAGDPSTTVAPMNPILSFAPGERLVVDMKQMPVQDADTGDMWILNIIDHFTKFLWAKTLPTKEGPAVATFLREVLAQVAPMYRVRIVQSDNGSEFVNNEFKAVIEDAQARAVNGRTYHPQSQGVVERKNRTVADKVKKKAEDAKEPDRWQRFVAEVVFNENHQPAKTTGVRPHLLFWGRDHDDYDGVHRQLTEHEWALMKAEVTTKIAQNAEHMATRFEKRYPTTVFAVGERVLLAPERIKERRLKKSMALPFSIPATVAEVLPGNQYKLRWDMDCSLGKAGEVGKKKYPSVYLKKVLTDTAHNWGDVQIGPHDVVAAVRDHRELVATTSGLRTPVGVNAASGPARPPAPTVLVSFQRLWNNGECACWLNALLAMGMIIRARLMSAQRTATLQSLTPLAQAFFNCVPPFDVNEFRGCADEDVELLVQQRNNARDNFRALYSTWFNNGNSGPGCFADPFCLWQSFKDPDLYHRATATGTRPVLPTAVERDNTLAFLHITDQGSKQCARCGSARGNSSTRCQVEMTVRRQRSFAEEIHDWLHGDRLHGTLATCRARVATESRSTPGRQTVEVCGGRVVQVSNDLHFGDFFVVAFTNTQLRPNFEEVVDIATDASKKGPMVRYRVVGIICYLAPARVHFVAKMYHDGRWWCYDDMVNNGRYQVIDNITAFTNSDRMVLLMKEAADPTPMSTAGATSSSNMVVSAALQRDLRSSGNPGSSSSTRDEGTAAGALHGSRGGSKNSGDPASSSRTPPQQPNNAKRRLGLGHVQGPSLHVRPAGQFLVPATPSTTTTTTAGDKRREPPSSAAREDYTSVKKPRQATPTASSSAPEPSLATLLPTPLGPRVFMNATSWPEPKQEQKLEPEAATTVVEKPALPVVLSFAQRDAEEKRLTRIAQAAMLERRMAQQKAKAEAKKRGHADKNAVVHSDED
jgi:hypothetical protein